ncbi:MAG: class I SAM-dependent methyltransferase, partial [Solirubrobacteraceae bacterium]
MATETLRAALDAALPERPFTVRLWDGTELPSVNGGPTFTLRSAEALGHIIRAPGQLGVGRAYVSGAIEVDSVEDALSLLDSWSPPPIEVRDRARIAAAAVRAGALRAVPHVPDAELRPRGRRHSLARDRRSVRHHYDVSNAFFELILGESMTYSCAIFSRGATTLEEAQETKL